MFECLFDEFESALVVFETVEVLTQVVVDPEDGGRALGQVRA
jgi:hypothetical protein